MKNKTKTLKEICTGLKLSPTADNRIKGEDIYDRLTDRINDSDADNDPVFRVTIPQENQAVEELSLGLELLDHLMEKQDKGKSTQVMEFTTDLFCGEILSDIYRMSDLSVKDYSNGLVHNFRIETGGEEK